jgi:hypothetical protein
MNKAEVKELIGVEPRKVYYCLWNDAENTRTACQLFHVVECESNEEAQAKASAMLKDEAEVVHNPDCLYSHLKTSYYQREGIFIPTVFVFFSKHFTDSRFGYFLSRWSLNPKGHMLTDIRGKRNCNMYSVYELDSEKPLDYTHISSNVERIYSKYAPVST